MRTLSAVVMVLTTLLSLSSARMVQASAVDLARMSDPVLQERYEVLIHELRCVQCEDNSLADSDTDIAADLRREIRGMLSAGQSDQQIKGYLVSRYSEFILFKPEYAWHNAWLWGLPLILLLIGVVAGVRVIKQRTALVDDDDADVSRS